MSRTYKYSPIVEAVCEFKFTQDAAWDATIPGLLYERIRESFPDKEQRQAREIKFIEEADGIRPEEHPVEFVVFHDSTRTRLIQVAPYILRINRLRPYSVWEDFMDTINMSLSSLLEVFEQKGIEDITLQYLNRITIPEHNIELGNYLNFRPFMGESLPRQTTAFIVGCVLPFANGRDECKVQLTSAATKKDDESSFLLEIAYSLAKPGGTTSATAMEWIENAHQRVEEIFEGCITDDLRTLFSGE